MKGWIYRRAMDLKDFGELFGINFIRDSGFALRDWVLGNSIAGDLSGMKTGSGGEPG